jgi:23S rRNA (guanosine2251-2'-O)-methyltransferase
MSRTVYTGFHAIEEKIKQVDFASGFSASEAERGVLGNVTSSLFYASAGPRVKKIIAQARSLNIPVHETSKTELDALTAHLSAAAKDHRGLVLVTEGENARAALQADVDTFLAALPAQSADAQPVTVLILDSITDPHNIGAIIRSACQFNVQLVIMPRNNTTRDAPQNEVVSRASAGAVSWVPVAAVSNLVHVVQKLKKADFWIYSADAAGIAAHETNFASRTALVLGSEGNGISRLLAKECDTSISIPTCGKIDSLNVSVAAGILLYEIFRQRRISSC